MAKTGAPSMIVDYARRYSQKRQGGPIIIY